MRLSQRETWLWETLHASEPPPAPEEHVVSGGRLTAAERLGIYRSALVTRKLGVLRETFERVVECVGAERFETLGVGYLMRHPSRSPAIERVGERFAAFLAELPDAERPGDAIIDLARLEWARLDALIAPDAESAARAEDFAEPDAPSKRLALSPDLRRLEVSERALELFRDPASGAGKTRRIAVAVWRRRFGVTHEPLSEDEAVALERAARGASFDEVCESFREPDAVARAAEAVSRWVRQRWVVALMALASLATGCASDAKDDFGFMVGPTMQPGDDCLRCHAEHSEYPTAPRWSAAGTVFPSRDAATSQGVPGVSVMLMAPDEMLVEKLTTNAVGNFYTLTPLPEGFRVALEYRGERIEMPCPPPAGNCGACHSIPPIGEAPGRIFLPSAKDPNAPAFDCETWMHLTE